jgi:D-alanine-D-alanine ligase-like ATP-grasp enzyme
MLGRAPGAATLAVSLDLLRSGGTRATLDRLRQDAEGRRVLAAARRHLYLRIWQEAAGELGAELAELGNGFLELRGRDAVTRVREQHVALHDVIATRLALDKGIVYRLLADESIPTPRHVELTPRDFDRAAEFVRRSTRPCVVKPADGTGGGGATTVGVRSQRDLRRAFLRCVRRRDRILVEEQGQGTVYRLLLLDGELIGAIHRSPPTVRGDGRSTIRELVAAENRRRLASDGDAGLDLLRIDLDCVVELGRRGLRPSTVPAAGDVVPIKSVTNQASVEDCVTFRGPVSPALVDECARAAAAVGLRLAGLDLLTVDPGRSLVESGGVIIDVNPAPGLHHHYLVADRPDHIRVAVPLLETLLGSGTPHDGSRPAAAAGAR